MKQLSFFFIFALTAVLAQGQASCEDALAIEPGTYTVDGFYGDAPPLNCTGYNNGNEGMWYEYTAIENTATKVTTSLFQNYGKDTRFHVYSGTCDDLSCVAGDDDGGNGYLSQTLFMAEAGVPYYIVFDNKWSSASFDFELTEVEAPLIWFVPQNFNYSSTIRGAVDMNGDFLDDILGASASYIDVNYQLPGGGFDHVAHPIFAQNSPSWSLAAGDLTGNGFNDVVLAGSSGVSIVLAKDDGTGYEAAYDTPDSIYVFSQRSNMVDINNDGLLDVFVCHDVEPNIYFINTGEGFEYNKGGLGDVPQGGNYGSIWVDYDNDGDMDLFIAKCRGGNTPAKINELHRNNGDGTFTEVGEALGMNHSVQTWSAAWGDYDNDGDLDVMIGASSLSDGGHVFMLNNGDGTFTDVTEGSGLDVFNGLSLEWVTHDFDNDGYIDILGGDKLLRNNGDMTFSPIPISFTNGPIGDLNNDGFLDVVDGGTVYFNIGNDNNYLVINTVGTASNPSGIGARITVYSPSFNQIRDIRSGDGFRFMSTLNAYFGLGTDAEVDSVQVNWPSGMVDVVVAPDINGSLLIVEGSTAVGVKDVPVIDLVVYPNPASDEVFIDSPQMTPDAYVVLYDINGRAVRSQKLDDRRLSVAGLAAGTYVLRVDMKGTSVERTLVVQ